MGSDKYIEQIAVIGDQRKFVSALIVPAYALLEEYAEKKGIAYSSREELLASNEIIRLIESHIEEHQKIWLLTRRSNGSLFFPSLLRWRGVS